VLGFYSPEGVLWLWIDLNAVRPCLLPWTEVPLRLPQAKSPLNLFLRAHFRDRVLRNVSAQGCVISLEFGDGNRLELRLIPHVRNILAFADGKQIAWQKPSPLPETPEREALSAPRSLEDLREEWLALRGAGKGKKSSDPKARLENELSKKHKALEKVEEELARKRDLPYKAVGDWLKVHQNLDVPREWEPFVDKRRKLSWNIEQCFTKARESLGKITGTEKRAEILREEIDRLKARLAGPIQETPRQEKPKVSLGDFAAQGRTLRLNDELTVVAGKSAGDNLKILRKARAWDLWFHLRDYPGSHAVLFRNKNTKVGENLILQVVDWFLRMQLGSKVTQHSGEKFAVLIAECRHVHPIKGDKVGRVTYHDERVLIYKMP